MTRVGLPAIVILALVAVATACESALSPTEIVSDSIRVVARVSPTELPRGDTLTVTAGFHNRLDRPIGLTFSVGCPFYLSVIDGSGAAVPAEDWGYACTTAIWTMTVPALDSVVSTQRFVASVGGVPIQPGHYAAQLDFTNGVWDLEVPFEVK